MPRCLVIEDSSRVRDLTVELVKELGFEGVGASGFEAAVEELRKAGADAVLLDWDLPKLGALDVLSEIAQMESGRRPAVVLAATENDPKQFALARAAGAKYSVLKPYAKADIAAAFAKAGLEVADAA